MSRDILFYLAAREKPKSKTALLKTMYDEEYAKQWISNHLSRKDTFRTKYLEPTLRKEIQNLPAKSKILDIGCGWGTIIEFLKDSQEYVGVDPTKEFFPYIRSKFSRNKINLIVGKLPNKLRVAGKFDFVICSLAIHCTKYLKDSVKTIFSKLKDVTTVHHHIINLVYYLFLYLM